MAFRAIRELRASCPQSFVLGSCPGYPGAASDSGCRAPGSTWRLAVDQQGPFGQSNLQKSAPIPVISGVTHLSDCQTARNTERLKIDENCREQRFVKLSLGKKENCHRNQCHPCTLLRGGHCRTWSAVWKCERICTSLRLVCLLLFHSARSSGAFCLLSALRSSKLERAGAGSCSSGKGEKGQLREGGRATHHQPCQTEAKGVGPVTPRKKCPLGHSQGRLSSAHHCSS